VREAVACAVDCLHLVNVCDTAGVREGLLTDALAAGLLEIRDLCEKLALEGGTTDEAAIERSLHDGSTAAPSPVGPLLDRLCRLRAGRLAAGEPPNLVERALEKQSHEVRAALAELFARCQFWYAEAGSAALSPEAQLKVFALGMLAASRAPGVGRDGLFHVNLSPLVRALENPEDPSTAYRVRLIETLLGQLPLAQILEGKSGVSGADAEHPLGTFVTTIGGASAVELNFRESREAAALLTLLPIYETKSSVAFHATLKTLCDLYGLRKDEFDRVANESFYLATMNSARSDKERMLDHVRPGRIVEVGPGGGVVLDLLERRFPDSEIIGIDASHQVAESLRQRRELERRRWGVVEADAFRLPEVVGEQGADCVVFCSVLHEIYSYVRYPNAGGEVDRFRLESVRDLLRAAYRSLVPKGRIVIRDGVMPPPGERIVRFLAPDARDFFELFCRQFEGRRIVFEPAGDDRVRLSSADAMEFLYTYTWGPESFPYEVREQYGILTYAEYRTRILEWLADFERQPRAIELPAREASYLQEGYRHGLAGKIELFDGAGRPVELPDSNCLIVIEKS
jgi:SAM-dependent methyltransferase